MSKKPAPIKVVNLEQGLPTVEQARLRMEHELHSARQAGCRVIKLVHGYGSSGIGGTLRSELQKDLRQAATNGSIHAFVAGEDWRISNQATWDLLQRYPEYRRDPDLGRGNQGISIVVL